MAKIAVVYYSSTGHVHQLALAVQAGAEEAGAEVRLRRAAELAPEEVIRSQDAWHEHYLATKDSVAEATNDDLEWADGLAFGTPTRYGLPTAQLKQFIDQTGPLWGAGKLNGKLATSFTSAQTTHGGLESTILALNNVFYHWGAIIVPPGYADPIQFETGTPYGTSHVSGGGGEIPESTLKSAHFQGKRLAEYAAKLGG
ncbi:MAG: NAD(P)H:quinone oxidoreductase [Solirubrobacterales bacterium]|nr:NAD(P)H:quinone oxidoreductase [Solirubrobacterales bacterium]